MYQASDLRKGLKIEIDGEPYVVSDFQFLKPGKGQSIYKCKMKSMISGLTLERSYRSGDSFMPAELEERKMQYLYHDGENYSFMDMTSYEQVSMSESQVGEARHFFLQNLEVMVLLHKDLPIGITLPNFINLRIVSTEPGVKGDTVSGTTKPATLSTGYVIRVPLFVDQDELIRVDTRTGEYVERVKG